MGHARSSVPRENVLHQDAAKVYQAECDIFDMVSIHWACPVALLYRADSNMQYKHDQASRYTIHNAMLVMHDARRSRLCCSTSVAPAPAKISFRQRRSEWLTPTEDRLCRLPLAEASLLRPGSKLFLAMFIMQKQASALPRLAQH